jgi:hypothetical protein
MFIFADLFISMEAGTEAVTSPKKLRLATNIFFFVSGIGYTSWASRIPSIQQQLI